MGSERGGGGRQFQPKQVPAVETGVGRHARQQPVTVTDQAHEGAETEEGQGGGRALMGRAEERAREQDRDPACVAFGG